MIIKQIININIILLHAFSVSPYMICTTNNSNNDNNNNSNNDKVGGGSVKGLVVDV